MSHSESQKTLPGMKVCRFVEFDGDIFEVVVPWRSERPDPLERWQNEEKKIAEE